MKTAKKSRKTKRAFGRNDGYVYSDVHRNDNYNDFIRELSELKVKGQRSLGCTRLA